jgi:SAM-dependent methyltransferase
MSTNAKISTYSAPPSLWVSRFIPLIRHGGVVLDLAAGSGRHSRRLRDLGFRVCAVDRDVSALLPLAGAHCEVRQIDLETGAPWPLGDRYDGIIVTNYLHRPLLASIGSALARGGVLIYETFSRGNEQFGHPRNPDFLLRPGELLEAFGSLTIVAFEQGKVSIPRRAVVQRLAAIAGPLGCLPEPVCLDSAGLRAKFAICRTPLKS